MHRRQHRMRFSVPTAKRAHPRSGQNGIATLTGSVDWRFGKSAAENHVHRLAGVLGVDNRIVVHPSSEPTDIKDRVQRAFRRHARLHAAGITIEIDGRKVTLMGQVPSVDDRNTAENAAWSAPGVAEVEDRLVVSP
jgi:osmotically-inducible protein OsmY